MRQNNNLANSNANAPQQPRIVKTESSSGNGYIIILTLVAMIVSLISIYSVVIVLFGMLPGLIAMIIDPEPKRYISKIVLTFNFTGIFPFIAKIISATPSNTAAIEVIIEPKTWLIIYSSAAIGWIIYWSFPQLAIMYNNLKIQIRIRKLDHELNRLVEEWGDEIKSINKPSA
jgi:hypothetical protein